MKRPERSRRSVRLGSVEMLETRALLTMTAAAPLPDMQVSQGVYPAAVDLDSYFKDAHATSQYAIINTSFGTIPVVLNTQTAPDTVANFLANVKKGDYTGSIVGRSVPGSTWSTGGYQLAADSVITPVAQGPVIQPEAGGPNLRGTVAMAPDATGTASDSTRFLFNETDHAASATAPTVFGHVVSDAGLAVMDAVAAVPVPAASPLSAPLDKAPLQYYTAGQPVQAYNLTKIDTVTTASEYFAATSDTPSVATVTVAGNQLTVNPVAIGTARIVVTGYGADGTPATESFTVDVDGPPQAVTGSTATVAGSTVPIFPAGAVVPPPTPVAPASVVIPTVQGSLPQSVVAGQRIKIAQTVTLQDATAAVPQGEIVTLSLSATGATADYTIARSATKAKPRLGQPTKVNMTVTRIGAAVPAGVYHLVVGLTDPTGAIAQVDTGETLIVRAPTAK